MTHTSDEEPVPEGESAPQPPAHKARKVAGVKVKPTKGKGRQTPGEEAPTDGKKPKSPPITTLPIILAEEDSLPEWARSHPCLWDRKNMHFKRREFKTAIRNENAAELNVKHPNLTPITGKF